MPRGAETVKTEVPPTATKVGFNEGPRGVGGVAASETWPVRPPDPVAVIAVVFANPPATSVRKYLLAVRTSAGPVTVIRISAEWVMKPPPAE